MKKIYGVFVLLLAFTMSTYGQATEAARSMSAGNHSAFSINLPNTNKKDVEKRWAKYLKKYKGKTNKIKKTEEYLTDNAKVENMSDNSVDIYSHVRQEGADTQLSVWYDLGGAFLSSKTHPEKITVANAMLDNFAISVAIAGVEANLKDEKKSLKDLSGDYKGLEKDKSKLEKEIEKYQKKIEEAKAAIVENESAQLAKKAEMTAQEGVIESVKTKLKEMN